MNRIRQVLAVACMVCAFAAGAMADGMIVPIRPDLPVRGHWFVKYHHVKITVRDQVASVHIDQQFVNTGPGDIEVEYLFPIPPGAAIDSMTLVVDGKELAGRLLEAKEARKIYEDIVRRKKDPALLEYVGFGLYRTGAFPLQPGKPASVIVTYKTICKKDNGLVEVFYPLNTEKFSARKIDDVKVTVDIKSPTDIATIYSPTHDVEVQRKSPGHVIATYHEKRVVPAIDFQVFYKAADEDVGATLLTCQPAAGEDGYFMMLLSPNPRASSRKAIPKDVVMVFDHSGSMSGLKIEQAKGAVRFILGRLNGEDRFNVIAYNDTIEPFFGHPVSVKKGRLDEALDRLDRIEAGGGTDIHGALQAAMKSWPADGDKSAPRPRYIIFLTDGLPTAGEKTDERSILADTRRANLAGARLFAFGLGYDVNVRLLDKLVIQNRGRSDYVKPREDIESKVSSLYAKIRNPVMTDLKVSVEGVRLADCYPRELPDLFDGDQIVLVGRYGLDDERRACRTGTSQGYGTTLIVEGDYEGRRRRFDYPVTLRPAGRRGRFAFVERLWAVRRVGYLLDQIQLHGRDREIVDELISLSKKYGIMTPYTSFLADESVDLAKEAEIRVRAEREAGRLARSTGGIRGQMDAKNRQLLNLMVRAPVAAGPAWERDQGVEQFGYSSGRSYEQGRKERIVNVRNVGSQTLYRRGKTWLAPGTEKLDLEKDADSIEVVTRFSDEYFELVRRNTIDENRIFAGQAADEKLLIRLRGRVYLIR